MPKPDLDVIEDANFDKVPAGSTLTSFDDSSLEALDGTDPADNLSIAPRGADQSVPSDKEFQQSGSNETDAPVDPANDDEENKPDGDKTQAPKDPKVDAPAEGTEETFDTEKDYLQKGLGLKDESVPAMLERLKTEDQAQVTSMKQVFAAQGRTLFGTTMAEINQELSAGLPFAAAGQLQPGQVPGQIQPQQVQTIQKTDEKPAFDAGKMVDDLLKDLRIDDTDADSVKFYKGMTDKIVEPINAAMKETRDDLDYHNSQSVVNDYMTDRNLYDQAVSTMKANKDDGPIPSFGDVRRLVTANPAARAQGLLRMIQFNAEDANPFLTGIGQWRASTNAAGLSNAQVAGKRQAARVAKFTKQTTTGKGTDRTKPRQSDEAAAIIATRKLPISVLERG